MRTQRLVAVDVVIKAVRDVLANQLVTVSLVDGEFTLTHSTPAAVITAPQVTLLMTVSLHPV